MPRPFVLPDLGEGLVEAEIVNVHVREGEVVREDAPLLEVETDKAQVEIPSPFGGRVERVHVRPGQSVRVGQVLVTFADASAGVAEPPDARRVLAADREHPVERERQKVTPLRAAEPRSARPGPVPAAPATRRLARELGIDLRAVRGSGRGGRVTDDDVRAASAATRGAPTGPRPAAAVAVDTSAVAKPLSVALIPPPLPRFEEYGPVERVALTHLRRTIAERMALSAALVPHVTHFDRADITELDGLIRRNLEAARAQGVTLTLTPFLLKAVAAALKAHPIFNASLDPSAGELILKHYYHLGVAVATDRGLIVPVLRDVDRQPLLEVARALGALAQRTREGHTQLDDLRGGTFTVTNIGALGGTGAIPIINYPEVAILGVARARQEPVVRDGEIVPRLLLPVTVTFDHRVADGADGARFATDIVRRLEHPEQLLLEL